jgi:hypothetical protein
VTDDKLQGRLRWAGLLIAVGLGIEVAVGLLVHPLAFVTFLVVACPLVISGILLFLWAVVA